jgi:hypothetical protein
MRIERPKRRTSVIPSDPAWEAMKAARSNLGHDDAVQVSVALQKQFYMLWGHVFTPSPVDLYLVLRTLARKRISYVLTGAHGIGAWMGRPRNTKDVDLLVKRGKSHVRAVEAIQALYPQLEVRDLGAVTAFLIPGEKTSVIDVAYPHRADLEETLNRPTWTYNKEHGLRYRVPSLEEALANKYGAMLASSRNRADQGQHLVDFSWMVTHSMDDGQRAVDLERLEILGEMVWPGGGGKEILRLVERVKSQKAIHLDTLGPIDSAS